MRTAAQKGRYFAHPYKHTRNTPHPHTHTHTHTHTNKHTLLRTYPVALNLEGLDHKRANTLHIHTHIDLEGLNAWGRSSDKRANTLHKNTHTHTHTHTHTLSLSLSMVKRSLTHKHTNTPALTHPAVDLEGLDASNLGGSGDKRLLGGGGRSSGFDGLGLGRKAAHQARGVCGQGGLCR